MVSILICKLTVLRNMATAILRKIFGRYNKFFCVLLLLHGWLPCIECSKFNEHRRKSIGEPKSGFSDGRTNGIISDEKNNLPDDKPSKTDEILSQDETTDDNMPRNDDAIVNLADKALADEKESDSCGEITLVPDDKPTGAANNNNPLDPLARAKRIISDEKQSEADEDTETRAGVPRGILKKPYSKRSDRKMKARFLADIQELITERYVPGNFDAEDYVYNGKEPLAITHEDMDLKKGDNVFVVTSWTEGIITDIDDSGKLNIDFGNCQSLCHPYEVLKITRGTGKSKKCTQPTMKSKKGLQIYGDYIMAFIKHLTKLRGPAGLRTESDEKQMCDFRIDVTLHDWTDEKVCSNLVEALNKLKIFTSPLTLATAKSGMGSTPEKWLAFFEKLGLVDVVKKKYLIRETIKESDLKSVIARKSHFRRATDHPEEQDPLHIAEVARKKYEEHNMFFYRDS